MIFITDIAPMLDRNVRLAANHAIAKKAIVDRLLKGYGVPIATLEAPGYAAFDSSIKVAYDPELAKSLLAKSGYSPSSPVKFKIQTTRGFKPKDYEMIQAVAGMWKKVGHRLDHLVVLWLEAARGLDGEFDGFLRTEA